MQQYLDILKEYWGYESFRGIQEDIIRSIGEGRDTLGLMPTGGGKSICFQVPAIAMGGLCLVITPLISLMEDQVSQLRMRGIKAETIHAGMRHDDILRVIDNCILGDFRFLYLSPERLESDIFKAKLNYMHNISLICVDEAHCISQWGYDFRPAYRNIAQLRYLIPYHVPVLALTATATQEVVTDIQRQLKFPEENCIRMSFERKNLVYVVRETENKEDELVHILKSFTKGSAIVYTRNRQLTSEIAKLLNSENITAENYHAGLTGAERDLRQINWMKGRSRVMVATNAFGMGIDKPDVRIVIHYDLPDSIEAYFQEAGRAGRDGNKAYAVMLYNPVNRRTMLQRVPQQYPPKDYIRQTYDNICYYYQIGIGEALGQTHYFSIEQFCKNFRQFPVQTDSALRILDAAGYIIYSTDNDFRSRVRFILSKEGLNRLENLGNKAETIISQMLRNYTGLFADFAYIDENIISANTGFSNDEVYDTLKDLNNRRILDYIPRSNQPTITFLTPRIESSRLSLTPMVYDQRLEEYKKRINTILEYAQTNDKCRSRMLLEYFGEESDHDCGQCDVCLSRKNQSSEEEKLNAITEAIKKLLKDGQWHPVTQLKELPFPTPQIEQAIKYMMAEEMLEFEEGRVRGKS